MANIDNNVDNHYLYMDGVEVTFDADTDTDDGIGDNPVSCNDKVSVKYTDGKIVTDVKYKKVEDDVLKGKCVII